MNEPNRIAIVQVAPTSFTHRLAVGIGRFASPARGFLTREFSIGKEAAELPTTFKGWNPDAVVAMPPGDREDIVRQIRSGGQPTVLMGCFQPEENLAVIQAEHDSLFDQIVHHFQSMGRRRIGQLAFSQTDSEREVVQEFVRYAKSKRIVPNNGEFPNEPTHIRDRSHVGEVPPELAAWLHDLPKPAGIFTRQHYTGPYVCRVCKHLGIRVPEDIAIIGIDGFDVSLWCQPRLTSVWFPLEEIGYRVGKLVAEMLAGKPAPEEVVRLGGAEIIARESTTPKKTNGLNILEAIDFIKKHACAGITVDDVISQTQGVSRRTFYEHFKKWNRISPAEAIRERKLSEARRLLAESELSITAVAGACGYGDDIIFRRVFRQAEGVSPREYRKMQFGS